MCLWFIILTSLILLCVFPQGPGLPEQPFSMCAVPGEPSRVYQPHCCSFGEMCTKRSDCKYVLHRGTVFHLNLCREICKASLKQVCVHFQMTRLFLWAAPTIISQRRRSGLYSERCVCVRACVRACVWCLSAYLLSICALFQHRPKTRNKLE